MENSDMPDISSQKQILVLGASGMLGSVMLRFLSESSSFNVVGTVRSARACSLLPESVQKLVITDVDVHDIDKLMEVFARIKPDIVINCVGLIKQLSESDSPLSIIPINSIFPHRLARLCSVLNARLIHFSTDCVFSGDKGNYSEFDKSDANDLYGRSKFLGETDYPNSITLRTSIIGHELDTAHSLIDWFLAQGDYVSGYRRAVFSGLPTIVVARIIRDYVIPHQNLHGLYHLSADPINKYQLLELVKKIYGKKCVIEPDDRLVIDRSLDSSKFRSETNYQPEPWPLMIKQMHDYR